MDKDIIVELFQKFEGVSLNMLGKHMENKKITFADYFIYDAVKASNALLQNEYHFAGALNYNNLFILKLLIESIAVLRFYESKEVEEKERLSLILRPYNKLKSYRFYLPYQEFIKKSAKRVERKYNQALEEIKLNFKLTEAEFILIVKKELPFLFDEKEYDNLVKTYLNESYEMYQFLDCISYPHDPHLSNLLIMANKDRIKNTELFLLNELLTILKLEKNRARRFYISLDVQYKNLLEDELYVRTLKETTTILKIADLMSKVSGNKNAYYYFLKEIAIVLPSLVLYSKTGESVIEKGVFKEAIDWLGIFYHVADIKPIDSNTYLFKLFTNNTIYRFQNYHKNNMDLLFNDSYEIYKDKIKNISKEEFKKIFESSYGLFEENKCIKDYVDEMLKDNYDKPEELKEIEMLYADAKNVSHSSGYFIENHVGRYSELFKMILILEKLYLRFINKIVNDFKTYILLDNKNKELTSLLNKLKEESQEVTHSLKEIIDESERFQ